jgi:hypothetical protein
VVYGVQDSLLFSAYRTPLTLDPYRFPGWVGILRVASWRVISLPLSGLNPWIRIDGPVIDLFKPGKQDAVPYQHTLIVTSADLNLTSLHFTSNDVTRQNLDSTYIKTKRSTILTKAITHLAYWLRRENLAKLHSA